MPVTTEWKNNSQTIIIQTPRDYPTIEDMYLSIDDMVALATSVDHPVYMVINSLEVKRLPANMLGAMRYLTQKRPDNLKALILVRHNNMFLEMLDRIAQTVLSQLFSGHHVVSSMEQAEELLRTQYQVDDVETASR